MNSHLRSVLLLAAAGSVLHAEPGAQVPLAQALESGGMVWRTGTEAPWFGSVLYSHDGEDVARSGGGGSGESWLETDATGPGALAFWVRSVTSGARVLLNDVPLDVPSGEWRQWKLRLGPGPHRVQFLAPYGGSVGTGMDAMFIDEVNFTPSAAVGLGEAADAPGLTWTGGPGAFGYAETGDGISGGDVVVIQGESHALAEVTGPALVRFRWNMPDGSSAAKFTVRTGTTSLVWMLSESPRGPDGWFDAEVLVPAGAQTVRWAPETEGDFLLDAVNAVPSPSAAAAVGQTGLVWSGDWLTRPADLAVGGAVAVTPVLDYGQQAALTTRITGPAEVTYLSSLLYAEGSDRLAPHGAVTVHVDGVSGNARESAEPDGWQRTTFFVPEGAHAVAWVVANDDLVSQWNASHYYQGVLDDVRITPVAAAGLAEALKTTLVPQVTEGAALSGRWHGLKSLTSGINGGAALCGPLAEGEATALTLPVTGPARLVFSLRGERWRWDSQLLFEAKLDDSVVLDNSAVTGPSMLPIIPPLPPEGWRTVQISIPSGAHTVALRAAAQSPGALLWLDALGYLPADPGVSKIAAAVEMPNTVWRRVSPPGRGAWRMLGTPMAREGKSLAACMDVPAGQAASLETTVTGPGVLAFSWGQSGSGTLESFVDDESAVAAWQPFSYEQPRDERAELLLPAGAHTVRWTFKQYAAPVPSPDIVQAWLDRVKFTPSPAGTSPAPGLDVTAAVTTDNAWTWQTAVPDFSATGDGDAAMVEVSAGGTAWLEMPLTGPGRFAFWWRAEAESVTGIGLTLDGEMPLTLPGTKNWYRAEFNVGPGSHTVRWMINPSSSGGALRSNARRVWLDGFTQLPTLPLAEALDGPSLTWTTGAPSLADDFTEWLGLPAAETAANPGDDDAAVTGGTRPLTTQVTGPGAVTFRWAEKSVPPQPVVTVPEPPLSPWSPVVAGGFYGVSIQMVGGWWDWNWWNQPPPPRADFAVNGVSRATLDLSETGSDSGFVTHTVHLGAGNHTLTWQRPTRSNGRRLVVESVHFTPAPDVFVPVAAELGVPVSAITMNSAPWTVQSAQSHDGTAALQSGSTAGGASRLEIEFTGPGELSFWWKGTTGADFRNPANDPTTPIFWIVNAGQSPWAAPEEWQRFTVAVPSGRQRYIWRAAQNATLWLDEVTFITPQPLAGPNAVAEALDLAAVPWNAPGWQPMTGGGLSDTGDALVGPEVGEAEAPWLETTVAGPATLRFSWRTETFPSFNTATSGAVSVQLLVDGVETPLPVSASIDRGTPEVPVPPGNHTLRFSFQSGTAQHRRIVSDDARLLTTIGEALGQPGLTWTDNSAVPWRAWQSDRYTGRLTWTEAPQGLNNPSTTFSMSTSVTGPVLISFETLLPPVLPAFSGPGATALYSETLSLLVDGRELWRAPSSADGWQTIHAAAGPGAHTITFKCGANFPCKLDNLVFTADPAPQPDLAEALETPGRDYQPFSPWVPVRNATAGTHDDAALAWYDSSRPSYLTTYVAGPAWVTFDYRSSGLTLKVFTDDGTVLTLNPDYIYSGSPLPAPVWKSSPRVFMPPGTHMFQWQTGNAQAGVPVPWVEVDSLVVTPLFSAPGEVPLAEALDAPGLTFTNESPVVWKGQAVAGATDGDAAVVISTSSNAYLKTTVTGPGTLDFRWRMESFGSYWSGNPPTLALLVDGRHTVPPAVTNPPEWRTVEWPIAAGEHTVQWFLRSQQDNSIAWVDDVQFVAAPTLTEAMEVPAGLTLNAESGAPIPATLLDGSDAAFLYPAGSADPLIVAASINGPGELSFDWKSSLPEAAWRAMVSVDGQSAGDWYPRATGFTRASIAVGTGEHVIRWHAGFANGGDGAGLWLDNLTWTTGLPAWAQAAGGVGTNGVRAWITGGEIPWTAAPGEGLNGGAAAKSSDGWIQAIVAPGPGTLCWWGRTVPGGVVEGLTGPVGGFESREWNFRRESRTSAQPLPLWTAVGESFITGVSFTPAVTVPLPQALDAPTVLFETSPESPWSGVVTEGAPLGASAAKSGYSVNGGSWLRTTFTGPGRLTYSSRLRRTGPSGAWVQAEISVDGGGPSPMLVTSAAWQSDSLWLEVGIHTVAWTLRHGGQGDEFWLDALQFTPSVSISLATALEYSGDAWTTGGTGNWSGLGPVPDATGDGAALSPALQENEEAWLETTVPGSGVLTWRWRVQTTSAVDFDLLLDGLPLTRLFTARVWQGERWELPAGPHSLRWRCRAKTAGEGQAMLDAVTFTPGPPPVWDAALGAQTMPMGGGGISPLQLVTEEGVTFLRNERTGSLDGFSMLYADVTGPAVLTATVRQGGWWYFIRGDHESYRHSNGAWQEDRQFIPAGRHRLRWALAGQGNLDLRQFRIAPLTTVPLAEALDAAGLVVLNDASSSWVGVREPGRPDDDDYAVALTEPDAPRVLEVEFTGPGQLRASWEWPAQSLENGVRLLLKEGETELTTRFVQPWAEAGGEDIAHLFGPGTHRVQLEVNANQQFFEARLSQVQFEQWLTVSFAEAMDAPGRDFTTGGDGWWAGLVRPDLAMQGNSVVLARVEPFDAGWMETEISGPAEAAFRYRISAAASSRVQLTVDDFQQRELTNGNGHEATGAETLRIPAGTHTVRWRWQPNGEDVPGLVNALLLDRLIVTPFAPLALTEAGDAPGLALTPVTGDWTGWRGPEAHDGGDFIEICRATGEPVSMTTTLTGPGMLRWWWRDDRGGLGHLFSASLDGAKVTEISYSSGIWLPAGMAIPPGTHNIAFNISASSITGTIAKLDGITWRPVSTGTTLANAAGGIGLSNWATGSPNDWFPVTDPALAFDGQDALIAPRTPPGLHVLSATAQGPGTLTLRTKSTIASIYNFSLTVDGALATNLHENNWTGNWQRHDVFAGATGQHNFRWELESFLQTSTELAAVMLDGMAFTPATPAQLAAALDQPGWNFRTGGPQPWQGGTSPGGANGNLAYSGVTAAQPDVAESWLETDVAGPGALYANFVFPSGVGRLYVDGVRQSGVQIPFLTAGPHTIRWAIAQPVPAVTASATLDNLEWQPGTWQGWLTYHFPAGTPSDRMSVDADPDADGLPNGIESMLGTSPLRPDSLPPLSVERGTNGDPRISFVSVAELPAGLEFSVQSAESLAGPWTAFCYRSISGGWSGSCYFEGSPGPGRNRYVLYGPGYQRFFRLQVAK